MKIMINIILILFIVLFSTNCAFDSSKVDLNTEQNLIATRINTPLGYKRKIYGETSWEHFLQNLELAKHGTKILDYKGNPIDNQYEHIAIINYDVGNKNLMQCADAIIRLRTEYLFNQKQYNNIAFHFTSGDLYSWNDHSNGIRPIVNGNNVKFQKKASVDNSYANFKNYLEYIYMYAGTISLNAETEKITNKQDIKIGDIIIKPGSPGHAVVIVDEAKDHNGNKVFLLAEGYTPAQSIHILTNPYDSNLNPWYKLKIKGKIITARYGFDKANIRRFKD